MLLPNICLFYSCLSSQEAGMTSKNISWETSESRTGMAHGMEPTGFTIHSQLLEIIDRYWMVLDRYPIFFDSTANVHCSNVTGSSGSSPPARLASLGACDSETPQQESCWHIFACLCGLRKKTPTNNPMNTKKLQNSGAPPGTGVTGKACKTGLLLVPSFARKLSWPNSLQETELQESCASSIMLNLPSKPKRIFAGCSSKMSCKFCNFRTKWFKLDLKTQPPFGGLKQPEKW